MTNPDVIVVGGGVIGAASAFFASRAGFKTTLLEKQTALGALTTSASLAAFRAQFADAENITMMRESIAFFEDFGKRTGIEDADIGLVQQGYLFVTTREDGYEQSRRRVDLQRALGLDDVVLWDGDEARKHYPYLAGAVTAATFRAKDGWLSAHELTYHYAYASGAEICLDTTVEEILIEDGTVQGVSTNHGRISAPRVVIAAGPFSSKLAAKLRIDLPLSLVRRQRTAIKEHTLIPRRAPMTIDADTGAHWRPDGHGAILAWALPEEPGEPREEVPADWDFPAIVLDGAARVSPFWDQVAKGLRRSDLDVRAGQYDMTPDAKPVISANPDLGGLYFNCGYSGHGVMASPAGGRVLADLMTGKLNESENPFRLARFVNSAGHRAEELVL